MLKRKKFSNLISKLEESVTESQKPIVSNNDMMTATSAIINRESLNTKPQLAPIPQVTTATTTPTQHTLTIPITSQNQIIKKIENYKKQPLPLQSKSQSVQKFNFDDKIPEWKKALIEKKKSKNFIA